uniref:Uncharacterized protein n=1 Tax=Cacopsylla melanoneura TaxID=428564 RepID=A0A8D8WNR6_9HEMI
MYRITLIIIITDSTDIKAGRTSMETMDVVEDMLDKTITVMVLDRVLIISIIGEMMILITEILLEGLEIMLLIEITTPETIKVVNTITTLEIIKVHSTTT